MFPVVFVFAEAQSEVAIAQSPLNSVSVSKDTRE